MLNVKLTEKELDLILKALNQMGTEDADNLSDAITYEGRVNSYV